MGKTVPSYRMAMEWEIDRWKGSLEFLNKDDREKFKESSAPDKFPEKILAFLIPL